MNRWFLISLLLTVAALGGSLALLFVPGLYDQLPERVPIHWNIHGQPDGWVPKENVWLTFLLIPLIMVAFLGLTRVLPWLSPRRFDLDRFRHTYYYIMFLLTALFAYIHFASLLGGLSGTFDVTTLVLGGMFFFFALIGNVLGKVQRNFYVGVRTPWTLASETVWVQTHRLAAWLFTGTGVLGFVMVLVGIPFYFAFGLILIAALVPVVYSLVLYKRLEKKGLLEPPAETNP
jgi:uncharacterized membrane protein